MAKRMVRKYVYEGFGFPIVLNKVMLREFEGGWYPEIDHHDLALKTIKNLPLQHQRITGAQLKFIRHYFDMTLDKFAKDVVFKSKSDLMKLEKALKPKMTVSDEMMLRLYIHGKVSVKTQKDKAGFFKIYQKIRALKCFKKTSSGMYPKR